MNGLPYPPDPRPKAQRSMSPAPTTLPLADVRRLNAVRERLNHALRVADTLGALRTYVTELASDLQDVASGDTVAPTPEYAAPDTQRMFGAPWDGDAAPATPRASEIGEEYGV